MARGYKIFDGPSKWDLSISLFDGASSERRPVKFKIAGHQYQVLIDGVEREDGSGENWNFHGRVSQPGMEFQVNGFYSTKRRQGVIQFPD